MHREITVNVESSKRSVWRMLLGPVDISSAKDYDDDRVKDSDTGVTSRIPHEYVLKAYASIPDLEDEEDD